jgi:anti-anti-sigma regulatory factor
MKITTEKKAGRKITRIEGDLQIAFVAAAKPDLAALLAAGDEILLDLGGVAACDTAGIQLLLMARASATAKGKRFGTVAQSPSFRAAAERAGIPDNCFIHREGQE